MVSKTVAMYIFFDDLLKSLGHKEARSRKTTDAEFTTVVLVAAQYFGGNMEKSLCFVSFPLAVCQNMRIVPSRLAKGKAYRGFCVSKHVYFYGFKVHMMATSNSIPVEFTLTTGSKYNSYGLK